LLSASWSTPFGRARFASAVIARTISTGKGTTDDWNGWFSGLAVDGTPPTALRDEVAACRSELADRSPEGVPGFVGIHEDVMVLDKPAGWVVHDAGVDAPDLSAWLGGLAPLHRLDRGTSGLVVYGRHAQASQVLEDAPLKAYLALVWGGTRPKGVVRRKLADARRGRALEAVTRYRTVERLGPVSYLRVRLETGRKHQIRRHMEGMGHPVVGDDRYRGQRKRSLAGAPERLWLHAGQLHLADGRCFEAPLPPSLADHLASLRAPSVAG
jgi:23S rRNA-/tRNA-specific pseudouridylate synthase